MSDPGTPHHPSIALILGAGFSKCADLPLQAEFSDMLLTNDPDTALNKTITQALKTFLRLSFGWEPNDPLPSLETVFTMIDLSANSGHTLGFNYPPRKLRALRRLLIYRVFSILDRRFKRSDDIDHLLASVLSVDSYAAFIVLNWDIVLERHLDTDTRHYGVDYGVNEFPWGGGRLTETGNMVRVIKVHGSSNWVYCDNC